MPNPGGKNQHGGPYTGAGLRNAGKAAAKSAGSKGKPNASGGLTAAERRAVREQMRANEERIAAPARAAAAAAGFTGPPRRTKKRSSGKRR